MYVVSGVPRGHAGLTASSMGSSVTESNAPCAPAAHTPAIADPPTTGRHLSTPALRPSSSGTGARAAHPGTYGRDADVFEDAHNSRALGEGRDHLHPAAAPRTPQRIHAPHAPEQSRPLDASARRGRSPGAVALRLDLRGWWRAPWQRPVAKCIHSTLIGVAGRAAASPLDHNNCDRRSQQL